MAGNGAASRVRKTAFSSVSGYVPLMLAGGALTVLAGFFLTGPHAPTMVVENGIAREDEGLAAHLWQLLMVLQPPTILFFAARWLPKDPMRTLVMIGLQVAGMACAAFPVWYLGL